MRDKAGKDHPPFYKFMSAATAAIVLKNRTLRWSTPGACNDPFDMQFDLALPAIDDTLKEVSLQRHYESMIGSGPFDPRSKLGRVNHFFAERLRATGKSITRAEFDRDMATHSIGWSSEVRV